MLLCPIYLILQLPVTYFYVIDFRNLLQRATKDENTRRLQPTWLGQSRA